MILLMIKFDCPEDGYSVNKWKKFENCDDAGDGMHGSLGARSWAEGSSFLRKSKFIEERIERFSSDFQPFVDQV